MTQVTDFIFAKRALLSVNVYTVPFQEAKQLVKVALMGLWTWTGHQDVIYINESERDMPEYTVHQTLEGLGRIL